MANASESELRRWIADFRIESSLILPPETPELRIRLPDCELAIQNASKDDLATESLAAQLFVRAANIEEAESYANERLREILATLSYGTSCVFRVSRQRFVMDWTPGIEIRETYAYGHDKPIERWPDLASDHLETLAGLECCEQIEHLRTPLRWFAAGIRSTIAEDQFQYFWFVLEIIAEMTKGTDRVTDKCARCRSDLLCPACNAVSEHRPFQKQAIEMLLTRLNVSMERQRDLFDIRNGIMHGRTRSEIEEEIQVHAPDFEMAVAVDFMWQTAFAAIFNAFKLKQSQVESLALASRDTVVSRTVTMKAHMMMGMRGDPANPKLEGVVLPTITAIPVNERGEEIDPLTGQLVNQRQ